MDKAEPAPELIERGALTAVSPQTPRLLARWIVPTDPGGWTAPRLVEWELRAAGYADQHPHDESAFVLEGELHVEVEGEIRIARAGDLVRVPADQVGRYWAPVHARMLGIYGPNPRGQKSIYLEYWEFN